ncbi:extracellular signal-regulated kinase 7 isoform X2 [Episyrphus balteatus]|uniref:extracellular signal-regulated kinase 7 isoform X2 n=1 Tax=Episyrphus balteatus TaxID=286459 RepID=UPI002485B291|nr:extracellular signal-regulated kinase 7 isoform X2 [Episyrphus balteatus]
MNSKTKIQEKNKMCEIDDHIFKYFEIKRRLGKGAYGIVWKALHKKTNQTVAVKKIFDAFRDETDAQRTFREIMFLRAFRDHPCIIQLHNVYKAANNLDIYLSFEFMESDLHNVIKKGNVLKDVHKRFIIYQLLNAISYIHSGNVIHRDLKPSNVLIDTKCNCKLADFGLARSVSNQQMRDAVDANESFEPLLTDYVATRWYRAPEILVASKRYTKGIDMWSLGCILGEMIRGKPIFQGNSTVDQIEKIVSALPEVTEKDIISVGAGFGSALLNKTISVNSSTTLDELLIDGTSDANDLVKRLLVLDPMARLTAVEALSHKYVEKFQDKIELIELNADVKPPFHDDIRLSVNEYRSKLYEIIQQTEKSSTNGKSYSFNRKRETRTNNKSTDNIPSKLNAYDEKLKRNAYLSQERKPYFSTTANDTTLLPKVIVNRSSNKVKIITPSVPQTITATNGMYPKSQVVTNLSTDQAQRDLKAEAVLSKSKYTMKSSVRNAQSSTNKNTSSSPELAHIQRLNSIKPAKTMMEKRHSIDGSYNYPQPSSRLVYQGNQSSGREKCNTILPNNNNHYSTNRQPEKTKFSNSGFRKSYQNIDGTHDNHQTVASDYNNKKSSVPSKSEEYRMFNDGSNYYEKRLKRLEEQIEKHKRDVKAFCIENTKHSKIVPSNKRQSESTAEQKITFRDKYYINGNGKTLEFRQNGDVNINSNKYSTKHSSSGRFDYLFGTGDDIDHRQAIITKYGERRPSKIT